MSYQSCKLVPSLARLGEHGLKKISTSELETATKPSNMLVHAHSRTNPTRHMINSNATEPGAEQVMSAAGRLHTIHGGFAMRICASYGAMNLGKTCDFDVARVLPSQSYSSI